MTRRLDRRSVLHRRVIRTAKRHWGRFAMADISGRELSYGRMLVAALMLSRWVRRTCDGQAMVGLLLPASMPAALANLAVLIAGKVPVNLNFTAGREAMAAAICAVRHHDRDLGEAVPGEGQARPAGRHGAARRRDADADQRREGAHVPRGALAADAVADPALRPGDARPRRPGHGDLLERQHRPAQGRDAVAPQRDREPRRHGARCSG